ncbi:MAG: DUF808 family protein [Enterobacteriaceae bacterium]
MKGAIRTDFILSAEIVAITLGIVAEAVIESDPDFIRHRASGDGGVYGLVGIIVKLMIWATGWWRKPARWRVDRQGVVGDRAPSDESVVHCWHLAMFLVGAVLVHVSAPLHHAIENLAHGQNVVIARAANGC